MNEPGKSMKEKFSQLGPAFFFTVIVFLSIPFEIISRNIDDLVGTSSILIGFISIGLIFLLINFLLVNLLKHKHYQWLARLLLAAGIFVLLTDVFTPLIIQSIETGKETAEEPVKSIIIDTLLILFLGVVAAKLPKNILGVSWTVGTVILVYQLYLLATFQAPNTTIAVEKQSETVDRIEFNGNIYHIVFDAYSGSWFPHMIRNMDLGPSFKDFTYFSHARSNYVATRMSFPSFTTGTLFEGGNQAFLGNWKDGQASRSLLKILRDKGFQTTAYSITANSGNKYAHENHIKKPTTWTFLADLWLLRLAPTFLRQEIFDEGVGLFSLTAELLPNFPSGDLRSYNSYLQFRQLLENESKRNSQNEYVFAHVYPPHGPYQLTRDGKYTRESTYNEQMELTTSMMAELIDLLKSQGKYDNSLIIFQSDHGMNKETPKSVLDGHKETLPAIDDSMSKRIAEVDVKGLSGKKLDFRTRALLLFKLPLENQDALTVSQNLVQLVDIKPVVEKIVESRAAGHEILGVNIPPLMAQSKVSIFHGYHQQDEPNGTRRVFGINVLEGYFNRYSVDVNNQWTIEDKVFVQY